jgi:hypothetical protein
MVMILCQQLWPYDDDLDNIEVPVASTFNWVRAKEFFLAPEITCTPVICSSGTAAMDVTPSADSITWSLTPTNLFSGIKTGTGKNATITAAAGASGQGKITYTFKIPSGESYETFTAEKTFWIGKPQVYSLCNHLVDIYTSMPVYDFCYGTHNDVEAVHPAGDAGIDSWEWRVTGGTVYPYGAQYRYATIYPTDYYNFMVEIRAHNNCGWTDWARMWTNVVDCDNYYLVFSPNPTTGETTLSIESDSKESRFDETAEWDLEVYNQTQVLKEKINKLKGKEHKIQTAGWKEGVYMVRVKYNDEILTGKLVVKK